MEKTVKEISLKRLKERQELREEIERTRPKTGFDVLLEQKMKNISAVDDYLVEHPDATRMEISEYLGISRRSVSRYLSILRKVKKIKTQETVQMERKRARLKKLQRLVYEHPEHDRAKLAKELGVAKSTLLKYLRELPKVEG